MYTYVHIATLICNIDRTSFINKLKSSITCLTGLLRLHFNMQQLIVLVMHTSY